MENQVAILGPAPDQGEEQNLGSGFRGGGHPLPQHTRTQHRHNQRRPWLGQLAAQEIMAPAPAWGSGHSTAVWVSSQARNQVLLGCTLCHRVSQHCRCARARIPRDKPFPSWPGGQGCTGDTHRP